MGTTPPAQFTRSQLPGHAVVIHATGAIDLESAPRFARHVKTVIAQQPAAIVIDLTEVEFLAAAGLEVLCNARLAAAVSTPIVAVAAARAVTRPIQLMHVDELIPLYPSLQFALIALRTTEGYRSTYEVTPTKRPTAADTDGKPRKLTGKLPHDQQ